MADKEHIDLPEVVMARGPMSEHTIDAIARMVVNGSATTLIASAVGRTPAAIHRALQHNAQLHKRIEEIRAELHRSMTIHHYEMQALLPEGRAAIAAGLRCEDLRVKVDTGKWLHEAYVPRPIQRTESDLTVRLGGQTEYDVSSFLEKVATSLETLAEVQAGRPHWRTRVKTGPEALPRAVGPAQGNEAMGGNGDGIHHQQEET